MSFQLQTHGQNEDVERIIGEGLRAFNRPHLEGERDEFSVVARDSDGALIGGALCSIRGAWTYLEILWVQEEWRKRGVGSALLRATERESVARGTTGVFLDTFEFQAPNFYRKHGYQPFGELPSAGNLTRYFFTKSLANL